MSDPSTKTAHQAVKAFSCLTRAPSLFRVAILVILVLMVLLMSCTSTRIVALPDYGPPHDYPVVLKAGQLDMGIAVIDKPDDEYPFLDRPFSERGLLALAVKLHNDGPHTIIFSIKDIVLESKNGERTPALLRSEAGTVMGGGFRGFLYLAFLFQNVSKDYETYGLPDEIIMDPREDVSGFLFFKVRDSYDEAKRGRIELVFSEISLLKRAQYIAILTPTSASP